ncbi:dual-specificity RNA methyltransferase RlmN [Fusibacter ferrireducens]|uniref:Probable dual-specificity RNA methyltransferase RlmN n=1 Tax=Fusibacter ferrireducens TaxID=2785058 RepID=A0ABR9ZZ10_9FIRM|nr:23S rRNA (adenine(2503)-C(2))-methyltransferase RlmN [Fusibacter ferrireducens]MBF4695697.1 23S rRNA (adenine(2503)-C(2))-methyltransferase RlmN [Fusibacter ferrireducens]
MIDIRNLTQEKIAEQLMAIGEKKFRAKQVFEWINKGVQSFDAMKNLPKTLMDQLKEQYYLDNASIVEQLESEDGTIKSLHKLVDNNVIESVFMTYKHGYSACISTQVGCRMNCAFCASTLNGMIRNLTAGEMLGQLYEIQNMTGKRIDHVVLMGSGEPLDNYEEVVRFLKMSCSEGGLNLSGRNITLSTCGIVPQIYKLADEKLQITLAISLHNPFDDERTQIMPINKKYGIDELVAAVDYYIQSTNRRVTFEYALIEGENDSDRHAEALGSKLKGKLVHVNLIPINAVEEKKMRPSQNSRINRFKTILMDKYNVNTTIRRELGSDINAACGQLRNQHIEINTIQE